MVWVLSSLGGSGAALGGLAAAGLRETTSVNRTGIRGDR